MGHLAFWLSTLRVLFLCVCCFLSGCWERGTLAPVYEAKWRRPHIWASVHRVQRGETLYAIAFRYDKDYRQLAVMNHIPPPYTVWVGQILQLNPHHRDRVVPKRKTYNLPIKRPVPQQHVPHQSWTWPAQGKIVTSFMPSQGQKGINLAGHKGDLIRAASGGVVAYAGTGLVGYGNLILIKHPGQFLTAYGNNAQNLVHEGQLVRAGQPIARMGVIQHRDWGVHFEIRYAGNPVNPLNYLRYSDRWR